MDYTQDTDRIILTNFNNFHIGDILECGQCFRFEEIEDMHYMLVAFGKVLYIRQDENAIFFSYKDEMLSVIEFEALWTPYFDLMRDYDAIITKISESDDTMQTAVAFAPGIRILQQDPWEMLISFIISANNRIPQIKQVVKNISMRYGAQIDEQNYAFPTAEKLLQATSEDLRALKTGFRDKYIIDAAQKVAAGALDLNRDTALSTEDLRKSLLNVQGVGEKVAHCILLFGYGRFDTFPVDTWVRKVMQQYYFNGETVNAAQIHSLAQERFGELSGFAQQYLFHYIRKRSVK